jgi:hypothetical protein
MARQPAPPTTNPITGNPAADVFHTRISPPKLNPAHTPQVATVAGECAAALAAEQGTRGAVAPLGTGNATIVASSAGRAALASAPALLLAAAVLLAL